jgi:hypothetical protein
MFLTDDWLTTVADWFVVRLHPARPLTQADLPFAALHEPLIESRSLTRPGRASLFGMSSRHNPFALGGTGGRPIVHRGSRKRLRRIKFAGNTSVDFWLLVALMLFMLFVVVPWLMKHPPVDHDTGDASLRGDCPLSSERA